MLRTLGLAVELGFFACAVWALHNAGFPRASWLLGGIVVLHYLVSYDRIAWLLGR